MICECKKEKEFGRIYTEIGKTNLIVTDMKEDVEKLNNAVKGNGKPGLITVVAQLADSVANYTEATNDLKTTVTALLRFKTSVETTEEIQKDTQAKIDKWRARTQWLIGISASVISTLVTILIMKVF